MTAVEFIRKEFLEKLTNENYKKSFDEIIKQAKEMEKEQHQETFKQSRSANIFEKDMPPVWESFEQYYNETFKSEEDGNTKRPNQ